MLMSSPGGRGVSSNRPASYWVPLGTTGVTSSRDGGAVRGERGGNLKRLGDIPSFLNVINVIKMQQPQVRGTIMSFSRGVSDT